MIRTIDLSKASKKFIDKLPAKQQKQIVNAIEALAINPRPHDSSLLKGGSRLTFRQDVGEYRVAYHFDDGTVYVELVGKRNDDSVYRKLKNQK